MKQCIIAAYAGLFISFAMSFMSARVQDTKLAAPEKEISVMAERAVQLRAETVVQPVDKPVPERIMVKQGVEIYDRALEEYLLGVLAAEMPASFEPEALKAQAVAARSYTLYCAQSGKHKGAQVCTDHRCCQAWKSEAQLREDWGINYEKNMEKITRAVEETAGEYLAYQGEAVFSAFHSSSAGRTEDCGAIWSGLPYLVSVESPEGEDSVPGYVSRVELSALDFRDTLLHACPEADFSGEESDWIGDVFLEDSGRVDSVMLGGCLFSGVKLRELFSLRSTAFSLECAEGVFVFTVTGYGHGVGMSQYGAKVMATQGSDYTAILAHYYPGTTLVT